MADRTLASHPEAANEVRLDRKFPILMLAAMIAGGSAIRRRWRLPVAPIEFLRANVTQAHSELHQLVHR